jgi:hypothetical protein
MHEPFLQRTTLVRFLLCFPFPSHVDCFNLEQTPFPSQSWLLPNGVESGRVLQCVLVGFCLLHIIKPPELEEALSASAFLFSLK